MAQSSTHAPASPEDMDTTTTSTVVRETTPGATLGGAAGEDANDAGSSRMSEPGPPRRRNRPALSCIQCRTRKIRCDRSEPCSSCLRSKIVNCVYEEARRPKPRLWKLSWTPNSGPPGHDATAEVPFPRYALDSARRDSDPAVAGHAPPGSAGRAPTHSISALSPAATVHAADGAAGGASTPLSNSNTAALAERVRQLEQQLADTLKRPEPAATRPPQTASPAPAQGILSKTRYFGASHWVNGVKFFPLIMGIAERLQTEQNSEFVTAFQQCKELARSIKAQRAPAHSGFEVGKAMPSEHTAGRLAEAYFRTFESVYRILHAPTFWREYQKYWTNPAESSQTFILQLQLCMAIGTCFQDDVLSFRQLATQWIYQAQIWLVSPSEKSRMTLPGLQIMCLLHLARETCGVGGDLTWISAGSLLRTAMYMGLHRDPDNLPKMSVLRAEMRRRLWATILEIVVQSSLDSGGPPLVSLSDFDTHPPSNFDDDQLTENEQFTPMPRPRATFTQTTLQLTLLQSFATRLAIAQYVNHFNSVASYDETLKWNSELTIACRALSATLQPAYDPAGVLPKRLSLFQLRLAEHMVHRFFLALNYPWLSSAQNNPQYFFARKMCVETSLKLYRAFATGSPAGDSGTASQTDDFTRLATCGYGAFRSVPVQAVLTICLELLWQAQEDRSFRQSMNLDQPGSLDSRSGPSGEADVSGGAASRQDLLDALKYSIGWTERRIRCGETNIKGHMLYSALLTQVEALQRGAPDIEVERLVLDNIVRVLHHCWLALKNTSLRLQEESFNMQKLVGVMHPSPARNGPTEFDWGSASDWDWDDVMQHQGFDSIFNLNDVDFFVGG
ncbi:hypothetical protein QBC46DRAFT_43239 [Diplogelasinospora grovesii]|uniref:Zn(2)-C6 fungal-type domain-containing protein n=1 Tax=Diplogelasinospora grovesii TaxID=303347 RepID=A0AAN6ND19_9PEZI|nr:hypothetical protein QBC46DRAFT_43239 [Diplogelasinospora grovesii]